METLVDIYRHVGVKVRIDLSRRDLPASRLSQLTARFDAVDATTGTAEAEVSCYDNSNTGMWLASFMVSELKFVTFW